MAERHPYAELEWCQRFIQEVRRLEPDPDAILGGLCKTLWALKGIHGMWPEEAAQRYTLGEFRSLGRR